MCVTACQVCLYLRHSIFIYQFCKSLLNKFLKVWNVYYAELMKNKKFLLPQSQSFVEIGADAHFLQKITNWNTQLPVLTLCHVYCSVVLSLGTCEEQDVLQFWLSFHLPSHHRKFVPKVHMCSMFKSTIARYYADNRLGPIKGHPSTVPIFCLVWCKLVSVYWKTVIGKIFVTHLYASFHINSCFWL